MPAPVAPLDLDAIEASAKHFVSADTALALVAEVRRLRAELAASVPVPEGLDRDKAAGTLWRVACAPLQWVTGPYPSDWPLTGQPVEDDPDDEFAAEDRERQAEAVREFQRANGLAVDGILEPQTWEALRSRNESHAYA